MKLDDVHITAGAVATTVIILIALYRAGAWLLPRVRQLGRFLDAWEGFTDSAGKHTPGVLERLARVEETAEAAASAASAANGRLDHVSAQVSEVRDLAEQTRDQAAALAAEQTQIRAALEEMRGAAGTDATDQNDPGTTD